MVTVFIRKIENLPESEKQSIISTLSASARARLESKRNKELYTASLCALSLLTDEQRADLCYAENGCPFFQNLNADISISHSASHAAVALSDSAETPVGIDVEDLFAKPPSARFFTENEIKFLSNTPVGTDVPDGPHLKIWTKKEALFKFLKNGSTPFICLDSTTPELHGAKFVIVAVGGATLTVCAKPRELIKIIEK